MLLWDYATLTYHYCCRVVHGDVPSHQAGEPLWVLQLSPLGGACIYIQCALATSDLGTHRLARAIRCI